MHLVIQAPALSHVRWVQLPGLGNRRRPAQVRPGVLLRGQLAIEAFEPLLRRRQPVIQPNEAPWVLIAPQARLLAQSVTRVPVDQACIDSIDPAGLHLHRLVVEDKAWLHSGHAPRCVSGSVHQSLLPPERMVNRLLCHERRRAARVGEPDDHPRPLCPLRLAKLVLEVDHQVIRWVPGGCRQPMLERCPADR